MASVDDSQSFVPEESFLKCPPYCNYFKFFLVEEIIFAGFLKESHLHFGQCSIIGKLGLSEEPGIDYYLDNIALPNLPSKYTLKEGSVTLPLVTLPLAKSNHLPQEELVSAAIGKYVQVFGEVRYLDLMTINLLSTHGFVSEVNQLHRNKSLSKEKFEGIVKDKYKRLVKIHSYKEIDLPSQLAEKNLEIRMICQDMENSA